MKIKDYPTEYLPALVEFATANCAKENEMSDYTISICRKIFRIIYNIVVKDSRSFTLLLERGGLNLISLFQVVFKSGLTKAVSDNL